MKMVVTFRNGIQIKAEVEEFSTGRSPIEGALRNLKWTAAEDALTTLNWLDFSEVIAVHAEREPGGERAAADGETSAA